MSEFSDRQIDALLYGETVLELDDVKIDSWFCQDTCEKNIDIIWTNPRKETSFIANGMTHDELKLRLIKELQI